MDLNLIKIVLLAISVQVDGQAGTGQNVLQVRRSNIPGREDKSAVELISEGMVLPGHTLIRPAPDMLSSAVHFPFKEIDPVVYGSWDRIGPAYYGDMREKKTKAKRSLTFYTNRADKNYVYFSSITSEQNASASFLALTGACLGAERFPGRNFQQRSLFANEHKKIIPLRGQNDGTRRRHNIEPTLGQSGELDEESMQSSSSSEVDRMEMIGDHMNIHPLAPRFKLPLPRSTKPPKTWWYYNQDDYEPFPYRKKRSIVFAE